MEVKVVVNKVVVPYGNLLSELSSTWYELRFLHERARLSFSNEPRLLHDRTTSATFFLCWLSDLTSRPCLSLSRGSDIPVPEAELISGSSQSPNGKTGIHTHTHPLMAKAMIICLGSGDQGGADEVEVLHCNMYCYMYDIIDIVTKFQELHVHAGLCDGLNLSAVYAEENRCLRWKINPSIVVLALFLKKTPLVISPLSVELHGSDGLTPSVGQDVTLRKRWACGETETVLTGGHQLPVPSALHFPVTFCLKCSLESSFQRKKEARRAVNQNLTTSSLSLTGGSINSHHAYIRIGQTTAPARNSMNEYIDFYERQFRKRKESHSIRWGTESLQGEDEDEDEDEGVRMRRHPPPPPLGPHLTSNRLCPTRDFSLSRI
ncbi:hypothetical protein L249_2906 [Ophiocordyceps polyrhachis-furcata BCC 54312]|uniref:Uncharacterized protein n=1 Tax=Ophiocordyceps polyrhachis-furcata BCC 54312 TaxID=1330021 RepID=A0A367LQA0_9HYPO|nr:hypothetical protein L249_2906 [Ophiocordyceps polyrhachis-furcata BCC 54312]